MVGWGAGKEVGWVREVTTLCAFSKAECVSVENSSNRAGVGRKQAIWQTWSRTRLCRATGGERFVRKLAARPGSSGHHRHGTGEEQSRLRQWSDGA